MPTISMFYGIVIRMLFMDTKQHHLPHLYVEPVTRKADSERSDNPPLSGLTAGMMMAVRYAEPPYPLPGLKAGVSRGKSDDTEKSVNSASAWNTMP